MNRSAFNWNNSQSGHIGTVKFNMTLPGKEMSNNWWSNKDMNYIFNFGI